MFGCGSRFGSLFVSKLYQNVSKYSVPGCRLLFSGEVLGLEGYKRQKLVLLEQFGDTREKFVSRVGNYIKASDINTVFTEDLKSMVYLAETKSELDLTMQMIRRDKQICVRPANGGPTRPEFCGTDLIRLWFHSQNSDLHFSNFLFGPVLMRLLYNLNKPDFAYELFYDKSLSGFFHQSSSCLVLMDMLYENKQYDRVLEVMDVVKEGKFNGIAFPIDCTTLVAAACYQMNTSKSLDNVVKLFKEASASSAPVSMKAISYGSMVALSQNKPEVALEMLSLANMRVGAIRLPAAYVNIKALTYAALGRIEEAVRTLRAVIELDLPDHVKNRGEVFDDVLLAVSKAALRPSVSKDIQTLFMNTEKKLREGGYVPADVRLADYVNRPIVRQRRLQEGYKHRDRPAVAGSRYQDPSRGNQRKTQGRPGLFD